MTTIAVDASGGDHAPSAPVIGGINAARAFGVRVLLVGQRVRIEELLRQHNATDSIEIVEASETIGFDEPPVAALKKKRDSSIVIGLSLVKKGQADAFVSAGSTGALLAGGLFTLGRIKGINRPALTAVLPSLSGKPFLLLDVGASTDAKPRNLEQYASMGSVYAERVLGISSPRVGLLNIGREESKGPEHYRQTYSILGEAGLRFVGNIEARDIFDGHADVLVCDGFTGNIVLKTVEGLASTFFQALKEEVRKDFRSNLGGLLLKPYLKSMAKRFDYAEYGGVPLLGLASAVIKCHGSSNATAVRNGIGVAARYVESGVTQHLSQSRKSEEGDQG